MEPQGSFPCSQEAAIGLYSDPEESSTHTPISFNIIFLSSTSVSPKLYFSIRLYDKNSIQIYDFFHVSYMSCKSHPS